MSKLITVLSILTTMFLAYNLFPNGIKAGKNLIPAGPEPITVEDCGYNAIVISAPEKVADGIYWVFVDVTFPKGGSLRRRVLTVNSDLKIGQKVRFKSIVNPTFNGPGQITSIVEPIIEPITASP